MNTESILTHTLLHPRSPLELRWNAKTNQDAHHYACEYRKAEMTISNYNQEMFVVSLICAVFTALAWLYSITPLMPIVGTTCAWLVGGFLIISFLIKSRPARKLRGVYKAKFDQFANSVIVLDDALRASAYMGVGHLFAVNNEHMMAFITKALVQAADKVLVAEEWENRGQIAIAKEEMDNLVMALRPFLGKIDVKSYYDRARNLRKAAKN